MEATKNSKSIKTVVPKPKKKQVQQSSDSKAATHYFIKKPINFKPVPNFSMLISKPVEAVLVSQVQMRKVAKPSSAQASESKDSEEPARKLN